VSKAQTAMDQTINPAAPLRLLLPGLVDAALGRLPLVLLFGTEVLGLLASFVPLVRGLTAIDLALGTVATRPPRPAAPT
jgi:hypothetical protein